MRKKRNILCLLFLAAVLLLFPVSVFAASGEIQKESVFDYADLLNEEQEYSLSQKSAELVKEHDMNFVFLTTNDAQGKSAVEYADDFYMDNGFYEDGKKGGITFLIDMDNREVWISTAGDMRYYVNDAEVEEILDAGYGYLEDGSYFKCFLEMAEYADRVVERGLSSDDYLVDENGNIIRYHSLKLFEILLAALAALFAAGIPCVVILGKYKVHLEKYDYDWKANSRIQYSEKQDYLVNKIVTHRRIPKNPPSGNEGGHGNGGSSIHTSSGGGSFGGGGRKF